MATRIPTLRLRDVDLIPFTLDDVDAEYYGWLHDIEVIRYLEIARQDRSYKALRNFVTSSIENPEHYLFKIVMCASGKKVGTISQKINTRHWIASYGVMIGDRAAWGTDCALQSQVGLLDFAFGELGLRKLFGGICAANTGANFNLFRLGFEREGIRRAHFLPGIEGDEAQDLVEYGCLAEEWAERFENFDQYRAQRD